MRTTSIKGLGLLAKALFFLVFLALVAEINWQRLDSDFGWHLQAGNYIREHGLPTHDIFTYTAENFRWINHEWGNDVLMSIMYQWGGYGLLAIGFALLWTIALFISGHRTRVLTLLVAASAILPFTGVRANVWTPFWLAILLGILRHKSWRLRFSTLPLVFVIWANFHGGFAIGLAILGYHALLKRRPQWFYLLLLCFAATFINPYGWEIYVEVLRTFFDRTLHTQIIEWFPFTIPMQSMAYICIWTAGFWIFCRKKFSAWIALGPLFSYYLYRPRDTSHFLL